VVLREPSVRPLLAADFTYDQERTLTRFQANGPLLNAEDNTRLRDRLRGSEQADAILSEENARFRVKTAATLLSNAPIDRIATAVGTISVRDTDFSTVAREANSKYGAVWEMSVQARRGSFAERSYILRFEPYGGQLVAIKRQ
jgi:hypothetical protein